MDRIIDLKNHTKKSATDSPESSDQKTAILSPPRSPSETENYGTRTRIIAWSGQLRLRPNVSAIITASAIFFAIAALVQIFQKNIITTVFFALIGFIILMNIKRGQEIGRFEINPAGVKINDKTHNYGEIKSFWIEYDPELGIQELSLQLKKWYAPYLKIPIYGQNPVQFRLALLEFLPEVEHKDSLVEIISRKLGL